MSMAYALTDSRVMVTRCVRRSLRDPEAFFTALMLPVVLMLLFVYVFGGAFNAGGSYANYVVPGLIVLCAGFGAGTTAVAVATDMSNGIVDRFRSMPISGSLVLVGHVVASLARNLVATALVIGVGLAVGWRPTAGGAGWAAAAAMIVFFVLALSWLAAAVGLLAGSAEAANSFTFVLMFLPYVSTAFVPAQTLPGWMRGFAEHQPFTPIVETMRGLWMGRTSTGAAVGHEAWIACAWCAASWRCHSPRRPGCSGTGPRPERRARPGGRAPHQARAAFCCQAGVSRRSRAVNASQAAGVKVSAGPAGSLESRTATTPGRLTATSTQFPALELTTPYASRHWSGPCVSHLSDQVERSPRGQGLCPQGIEDLVARPHDVGVVRDLALRGRVQVHHVRSLAELGDGERAGHPTCAPAEAGTTSTLTLGSWTPRRRWSSCCTHRSSAPPTRRRSAPSSMIAHSIGGSRRSRSPAADAGHLTCSSTCSSLVSSGNTPRAPPGRTPAVWRSPGTTGQLPGPQRQRLTLDARPFPEPRRPDLPVQLIPQVRPQPQQRTAGTQLPDHVAAGGEVLGGHPPRGLHRADQGGRVADPLAELLLAQPRGRPVVPQLRAEQRERARTRLRVP